MVDDDRYTPQPYEAPSRKKPEAYHMNTRNDSRPMYNEPKHQPPLSPVDNFRPSSSIRPEFYHLKAVNKEHDDIPHDDRSSPAFINSNRVSPMPYQNSKGHGVEVYYLSANHENNDRQSPNANDNHEKPMFSKSPNHYDDEHPHPTKVTTYLLTTRDEENLPPPSHRDRTPSPPIRPIKKQPVAYDIVDDDHKDNVPIKQRPFPTGLHDVPTNIRHFPSTHSKASESIQRSMNKYRFGGS